MVRQLGSALDDHLDGDTVESYIDIPAKIGFFKKLKLERDGKELPKERIYLPIEANATIFRLFLGFFFLALGIIFCVAFYILLFGPDDFSIGERIWFSVLALIMLPLSLSGICLGIARCRDFFLPGPFLVIEKDGFRSTSLSAALIPWSDIVFYSLMSSKGSIYGIQFYLRNIIPNDRRWLHKRFERVANIKGRGATSAVIFISGLSSSKRILIEVMTQLARQHGAK